MIDHDRTCGIWRAQDRACTCTVVFPFPNPAGKWDGWLGATAAEQEAMKAEYRRVIDVEILSNFMHEQGYRGR
jgi:hypothetical protein